MDGFRQKHLYFQPKRAKNLQTKRQKGQKLAEKRPTNGYKELPAAQDNLQDRN